MASFDHNRGGVYHGRYGNYEVSIRPDPQAFGREILIRHQDGFCVGTRVDHHDLHRHHSMSCGDPMIAMVEMAIQNFERQYEEKRHNEMRAGVTMMADPSKPMNATQINHEAEMMRHKLRHLEQERAISMAMSVPATLMVGATGTTPKQKKPKKGKMSGTLREQLQAETDEWLKEVRAA